ncbi:MAG: Gfo/Idh/MocA family oxidoreductase [Planctomycetia bacterium]|jgi:predicted dehydrogenase
MNLTPEQKATGKENFYAALGSEHMERSDLLEGINKGISSGNGLGSHYYKYGKKIDEPIRVAVLGTGDEGSVLIGAINPKFVQVVAIADVRPYNIYRAFHGDHYSPDALKVRCGLMAKYGWKTYEEAKKHVKIFEKGYRQLIDELDPKKYDAVIIGLPLFLHAPAAIAAMKKGKHVLTEKLMAHSVHECKEMARVAKAQKLFLATGHQRHYNVLYHNANELISNGLLGDLHYIRAQWHRGNLPGKDSWRNPLPESVKPGDDLAKKLAKELKSWEDKLADLRKKFKKVEDAIKKGDKNKQAAMEKLAEEIALWNKKVAQKSKQIDDRDIAKLAESFGYQKHTIKDGSGKTLYTCPPIEELIRWRLWDRTGGGLMAELGSHQLDAASIFISAMHGGKKQLPLNVSASSCRPLFPANRDIDDHVYCLYEFPGPDYDPEDPDNKRKRISVAYASVNGNGFGGYGETVFGTEGTLLLQKEQEALLYHTNRVDDKIIVKEDKRLKLNKDGDPTSAAIAHAALGDDISRGYTEEIEHWAWCIKNSDPTDESEGPGRPHCHPEVALDDAVIALTTNIAARENRRISFEGENANWFKIESDATPEGIKPNVKRYS